ncbi:hypothetical protein AAES_105983 [Amazona aestiva]|uniref:Uncharacterized protein n=1 Tax=Amazona aestiva TaxID=12930 RepID=A0A0Q3US37_AMAAE|nr:hypothetical protein AAES_105983 [Amazona aestiva]
MSDQHHCTACSVHAMGSTSSGPSGPSSCGFYNCEGLKTLAGDIVQRHSLEMEVGRPMKAEKLGDRVAVTDAMKLRIFTEVIKDIMNQPQQIDKTIYFIRFLQKSISRHCYLMQIIWILGFPPISLGIAGGKNCDFYYGMVTLSFTWPAKQNQSRACSSSDNVQLSARMTSHLQVWHENSNAEMLISFGNCVK